MDKTKLKMRKLHSKREKTFRTAREIMLATFERVVDSPEYQDDVYEMTCTALGSTGEEHVDTTNTTVKRLMEDPKVQVAFKKFCKDVVGAMQYMESY